MSMGSGPQVHEGKQPEREPVVLTINLRSRVLPATAALAAFAVLPFLGAGANPAVGSPAGRLAAGTPTPALVADAGGAGQALYARAAQPGAAAAAGARMAFPNLALGPALPGGIDPAGVPGSLSALYAGNLVGAPGSVSGGPTSWGAFAPWAPTSGAGSSAWSPWAGGALPPAGAVGAAGFIRPVDAPETSGFGPRRHPVLGRAMFHTGIDLGAVCGTPIRAAADGTVVYAATTASWGNRIIIQHSPTLKTAYGHQSRLIAKVGQTVKQGDVIGLVGTTGWSTGCHLHFDVVLDGRYVDPAPYLGFASGDAASVPFANPGSGTYSPSAPGTPSAPAVPDGDVPLPAASPTPSRPSTPATPSSSPAPSSTSRPGTSAPKPTPSSTTPKPTSSSGAPKPTTSTGTPKPTTSTGTPKPTTSTGTPKPTTPPTTGTGTKPPTTTPPTTSSTTAPTSTTPPTTTSPAPGAPSTSATPTSSTPTPTTSDTCSPSEDPTGSGEATGATPAPTSTGAPTDTCAPDAASAAEGGEGAPVPQALAATAEAVLDTVG
jgi:murein DD-endopeptidase MepM/ murein hydrolase activator NlpD